MIASEQNFQLKNSSFQTVDELMNILEHSQPFSRSKIIIDCWLEVITKRIDNDQQVEFYLKIFKLKCSKLRTFIFFCSNL